MREARMGENPGVRLKWCISTTQVVVTYVPHRLISINKSALLPFPGCTAHSACGTAKKNYCSSVLVAFEQEEKLLQTGYLHYTDSELSSNDFVPWPFCATG